jgi:hypothetical protein
MMPMIIKGGSRSGPRQLARHLSRTDTNERVQVLELQSPTGDLTEALRDWQTLADGTRGTKGLYHANIDPAAGYTMSPEQWRRSVDVLEQELGLTGQPRTIVMHEKNGREHIHVVWQRTDIDTMTMVPDSFNYVAHERASLALEQEFGHEHVPGKHAKRDREKQPEFPQAEANHAEWQQGERTGIDPRAFKEAVTQLHQQCDTGQAFKAALEEKGYLLAKGDRRDYVIVDGHGQVYSLARQIKGVTAKDLRAFMADIDREAIQGVEQAKALQREARTDAAEPPKPESEQKQPESVSSLSSEEIEKLRDILSRRHAEETKKLTDYHNADRAHTKRILDQEIDENIAAIDAQQKAALARYDHEHKAERTGFAGFIASIRATFNPERAWAEAHEREQARAAFSDKLEQERNDRIARMQSAREHDLSELVERQAQQIREREARFQEDLARRIRDHEEAQRFLARVEEQRRLDEERRQQYRPPEPEPPERAR